jgi:hypothetical protein
MARKDFPSDVKMRCLLWSNRHCVVCDQQCGSKIVIAHMPGEEESDSQASAIPLCFDCHDEVGRYNPEHPIGNKYTVEELRELRAQTYEKYTRHLVPPLVVELDQRYAGKHGLPSVGFLLVNSGNYPPVRGRITVTCLLGDGRKFLVNDKHGYYSGRTEWHLNPGAHFHGNFSMPEDFATAARNGVELWLQVGIVAIDSVEMTHGLLPVCFKYSEEGTGRNWFLEPTSYEKLKASLTSETQT